MDKFELEKKLLELKHQIFDLNPNAKIIIASKTQSNETIDEVMKLDSLLILGENRVQEFVEKFNPNYDWHFIGQLQSNKVKQIVDKVQLIHSLDRLSLAEEIERQAKKINKKIATLIEINIGSELSKGGVAPENFLEFAKTLQDFENVEVKGVMCVAPNLQDKNKVEDCFKRVQELFESAKNLKYENFDMKIMSAGMSNDFLLALKNGSTHVRLGRALFGERKYI